MTLHPLLATSTCFCNVPNGKDELNMQTDKLLLQSCRVKKNYVESKLGKDCEQCKQG